MKNFFKIISNLYSGKLILVFLAIFLIIRIPLIQVIPDFLKLGEIESPQSYILRLLSIVIGFSSFILTILLLAYNTFSKKIKRNSFDFVLNNPWIKITFSLFSSSLVFIFLVLLTLKISDKNTIITLVYLSSFLAFSNLLIQFPLLILSIKHSNSYEIIKKLIDNIDKEDLKNLHNPQSINEKNIIDILEKNKLTQLKDIGITAIKENDWGLPQTIINRLYDKLVLPLDKDSEKEDLIINLSAFNFLARHFKKVAIEESDEITTGVLLNNLLRTHIHLAKKEIRDIRNNPIDGTIQDLIRLLIENNSYYNLQPYLLNKLTHVIKAHIDSVNYSDEILSTSDYLFKQKDFDSRDKIILNYWFYLKNELPDLFFKSLEHSIEKNNKNVYDYFFLETQTLLSEISNSKHLTESQENDIFQEYSYKTRRIIDFAIENNIYRNIEFYSHIQLEDWIINNKKYAFSSLYDISFFLKKLNNSKNLNGVQIDEFFMIARSLSTKKIDKKVKQDVIKFIIEYGFEIFEDTKSEEYVKNEIIRQLKWLNGYLEREKDLTDLKKEFYKKIDNLKASI
ncbi:DUF2254 family protein [Tenacibaculum sp. C7A-26P2]|uniref:DUF2254 family protein n=1 Tax=Tenacibaculum sp. C7A-26P2 TaxID=3447504 RepID=UPI003F831F6F